MLRLIFNALLALKINLKTTKYYAIIETQLCAWLIQLIQLIHLERVIRMPMRMRTEKIALRVARKGWIGVAFGVALFGDIYTDAAALVIQSEQGTAILRLFDPYAPAEDVFAGSWPEDARIALYSNHYQHGFEPTEDDLHNLAALPECAALYIVRGHRCVRWRGGK